MTKNDSLFGHELPAMRDEQARIWAAATEPIHLPPLRCKAFYVAGLLRHLIESAAYCYGAEMHLAAYQLVISSFEPLATVTTGRRLSPSEALSLGLTFAIGPDAADAVVATTSHGGDYTIDDCIDRRNFTAHGGKEARAAGAVLDTELTLRLRGLARAGLDSWWASLYTGTGLQALADAPITPLFTLGGVIFVGDLFQALSDKTATPGGAMLHDDAWQLPPSS